MTVFTSVTTVTTKNAVVPAAVAAAAALADLPLAPGVAARELELKRAEFELAVQLGHIHTVPGPGGGHRRVTAREVARLRAAEGFPEGLRERVRTVGTAEGAELLGIAPGRFTRLARAGRFAPVRCYLNRYRAVVWLYLADELVELALRRPELLGGRHPEPDRDQDWRPRNWRARRIAMLARQTDDQWELAAAVAGTLDSAHLAHIVPDPYERAHLRRLCPETFRVHPESPTARGVIDALVLADEPDEIDWCRLRLVEALADARDQGPAPSPAFDAGPTLNAGPAPGDLSTDAPEAAPAAGGPSFRQAGAPVRRSVLGRLRRGGQPGRGGRRPAPSS